MINHEYFYESPDAVPTQPPESLPPTEPSPVIEHHIWEYKVRPPEMHAANEVYKQTLGVLTRFVNGFNTGNVEEMQISALDMSEMQAQMRRLAQEISLTKGKG